jgi:hypothetical protein
MGELAEPALLQAATSADLELRRRGRRLLDKLTGPLPPGDRLREVRAVEVLELVGAPAAKRLLEELAAGEPAARLTLEAVASMGRLGGRVKD